MPRTHLTTLSPIEIAYQSAKAKGYFELRQSYNQSAYVLNSTDWTERTAEQLTFSIEHLLNQRNEPVSCYTESQRIQRKRERRVYILLHIQALRNKRASESATAERHDLMTSDIPHDPTEIETPYCTRKECLEATDLTQLCDRCEAEYQLLTESEPEQETEMTDEQMEQWIAENEPTDDWADDGDTELDRWGWA